MVNYARTYIRRYADTHNEGRKDEKKEKEDRKEKGKEQKQRKKKENGEKRKKKKKQGGGGFRGLEERDSEEGRTSCQ